jgi:hypothetical protein
MSKRGRVISNIYFGADCFDDDDDEIADGQTLRVPALLMDSNAMLGRRPGYAALSDDQVAKRQSARDSYIADLNSAWRMDKRKPPPDDDENGDDDDEENNDRGRSRRTDSRSLDAARAEAQAARDAMVKGLSNAWRNPPGVAPPKPTQQVGAGAAGMVGPGPNNPGAGSIKEAEAALEADRQKIHKQFSAGLSEAWRR